MISFFQLQVYILVISFFNRLRLFFFGRMAMLGLCCHAMMLKLAMIPALTPSKPGNWTNSLLRT
jgi:hypothetical protein